MASMRITIENAGKRFNFEWILRNIDLTFHSNKSYAILGPNGSGKSTLLQLIAGNISPSAGTIEYFLEEKKIEEENIFRYITLAAPYLELIEDFTASEIISFQQNFKPFLKEVPISDVLKIARLEKDSAKPVKDFSSGMKQRLKVSLAMLADVQAILLDEPTTNLDQDGFEWYLDLMKNYSLGRLVIICSNLQREYQFCDNILDVMRFKSSAKEISKAVH